MRGKNAILLGVAMIFLYCIESRAETGNTTEATVAAESENAKVGRDETQKAGKSEAKAERKAKRKQERQIAKKAARPRRQFFGAGPALIIPTSREYPLTAAFSGNLMFIHLEYILARGGSFALYPRIRIGSRVELHIIGLGVTLYHGDPLTAPVIPRWWDIHLRAGIDVRIWRGLELRAAAAWYVPNPKAVYDQIRGLIGDCGDSVGDIDEGSDSSSDLCEGQEDLGRKMISQGLDSLKHPFVSVGLVWTFDLYGKYHKKEGR